VTLHLNLEISSLGAQSVNGIPVITNQSVEQTIRLRENETTMVMGIRQPEVSNTLNGWPYVSSVPGLGLLSSNQGKTNQDSDIIVMITPRLVEFSPRKDRLIYAGRGSESEGGSFGGTGRGFDRGEIPVQLPQPPQQPPQPPPQTLPQPLPVPQPSPNPENDAPPQPPPQP
jgi:hypothetical protein